MQRSSRASSREPSQERPGSRSPHGQASPSREEKEAEDAPIPATVKAMVDFIKSNFPDAIASPSQKSSRSFDLSVSVGVSDPETPSGSLLGWSQVMSDSFTETQKKFSKRIQEGRACHTLLPSVNRLEKVSNSPSQGKELIANRTCLTSSETRSLISVIFPSRLRRASLWKGLFALSWSPRVSLPGR